MLIDGKTTKAKEQVPVINPYDGNEVGMVCACTKGDVKRAVDAAKKARGVAKKMTPYHRYELLFSVYEQVKENKEQLARLITSECGKTIKESRSEVGRSMDTLLFSAEEAKRITGETMSADVTPVETGKRGFTILQPIGVVAAICPFNFPLNLVLHKVAPAIASGNTLVVKPASQTPLTAYKLGEMLTDAGAPPGLINIVSGRGSEVGAALVKSDVNMITFTGSVEVGQKIAANAGMKKMSLELGGNGPLIIMDDADLDKAIPDALDGAFGTAGQRCTAVKRILLHNKIADEFIPRFVEEAKKLRVGDPMDDKTDVGPLINESAAIDVEERVEEAVNDGAEVLLGRKREKAHYWPTVLDNVPRTTRMVQTETFGPTAPIIRFDSLQEAVEIANETPYGLQAGIFSEAFKNIKYAVSNIESGAVVINGPPGFRIDPFPFGGVKYSGMGREGIKYAIREMTEIKTVFF
ncbi:aldehyde dehydrogenase family protein [archaeon]